MKWFNRRHKEGLTIDQVVFLLIKLSGDVVKDASRELRKHLDAQDRSKLPKVEEELIFFFLFALDYWWQTAQSLTQEETRIWKEIFSAHLRILFGDDPKGLALLDTFQERLFAYAEIANEKRGDTAKLLAFGAKLSDFCGITDFSLRFMLAPSLFTQALEAVSSFGRQRQG